MAKYYVRQRRPMWVCLVQEIEADDEDQAYDRFHDDFAPQTIRIEDPVSRLDYGLVSVFEADDFENPEAVIDED